MTIVYETWQDKNGIQADIKQEKYSACFALDVYRSAADGPALMLYHYDMYGSTAAARRAMRRILAAPECTYKRKKGE